MTASLADLAWPDVGRRAASGAILAIALGSTEQHGPHLPLSTDTDIAVALCARLTEHRTDVLTAPAVAYGSSGEHGGFAGTLSIGQAALELLIVELVRSATDTFAHVLLVSAHGGNAQAVGRAVATLHAESRDVLVFSPRSKGDAHAGQIETSLQLLLNPQLVRRDRITAGETRPLSDLMPTLRSGGVRAVTPTGVLGDPTGASAASGSALFDKMSIDLLAQVNSWRPEGRQ